MDKIYRHRFATTFLRVQQLIDDQGGVCAICGREPTTEKLNHDHDHLTGRLRGMLCGPCNRGLGALGDQIEALERAIEYLKNPPATSIYE